MADRTSTQARSALMAQVLSRRNASTELRLAALFRRFKNAAIPALFERGLLRHIQSFQEVVFEPAWVPSGVAQLLAASQSVDKESVAVGNGWAFPLERSQPFMAGSGASQNRASPFRDERKALSSLTGLSFGGGPFTQP